jgi:C1q domain
MPELPQRELGAFIDAYMTRKYARLFQERFFQGTVQAVTTSPGGGAPLLASIIRIGETAPDGNLYAVVTPGYYPLKGARVECFWRDQYVGYCLGPVDGSGNAARARVVNSTAQSIPNSSFTTVALDTVIYDPNRNWDAVNFRYTVPVTGYYYVAGFVEFAVQVTNMHVTIYKNGSEVQRLLRAGTTTNGTNAGGGSDILALKAGDLISLVCFQGSGAAVVIDSGFSGGTSSFMAIEYRGG